MTHGVLASMLRTGAGRSENGKAKTPDELATGWTCKKRDGKTTPFDCDKIRGALSRCFNSISDTHANSDAYAEAIVVAVVNTLAAQNKTETEVEEVQRLVIQQLWA